MLLVIAYAEGAGGNMNALFLLWVALCAVIGITLYMTRSSMYEFIRFLWEDWTRVLCCGLVALAISAFALNQRGIHPLSLPGMILMSIVTGLVLAIFLRWGETQHPGRQQQE